MGDRGAIDLSVLRPMAPGDLDAAHALSVEVGWPHRPDDWRLVQAIGEGVVATDEGGRVMGSAMWWPFGPTLATIGMVIVSPRLQGLGTGRRMMRVLSEAAGDRTLRLVATEAGQRLYASEGFRPTAMITQFQGTATPSATVEDSRVRAADETDWSAIMALDAEAIGGDRSRMLAALRRAGTALVLEDGKRIAGYAICRPFGRGHAIGPVVASDVSDAVALAGPFLRRHAGTFLRLDTPDNDGLLSDFLETSGLRPVDRVAQMTRGAAPATGPFRVFALAAQALG